jgi:hypothetical protein
VKVRGLRLRIPSFPPVLEIDPRASRVLPLSSIRILRLTRGRAGGAANGGLVLNVSDLL